MTEPQIGLAGVVVVVIGIALGSVPWLTGCGTARELDHDGLKQLLAIHSVRARVDEVRKGKDEIWIKYYAILEDQDEEAVFYARASWDTADAVDSAAAEPLVLPLEFHTAEEWEATPDPVLPVSIHDSPQWHELQLRWVESMTPAESGHGVVVRSDRDELLYYRDADGKVNLTVLEEKPDSVRIVRVYGPRELRPLILSLLDENLDQFGVNERRVLFETGRYGAGAAIVLYADLDARRVFLLRLQGEFAAESSSLNLAAQAGSHVIVRSTAASFLSNPFSTLNRFLFLTGNNVYDLTRPSTYLPESSAEVPPLSTGPPMDTAVFEEELDGLTGTAIEMGTLRFLIDGEGFFP